MGPSYLSMVSFEALHEKVLELNPDPCAQSSRRRMWKLMSSQRLLARLFSLAVSSWRKGSLLCAPRHSRLVCTHPQGCAYRERGKFTAKFHKDTVYSTKTAGPWEGCVWRGGRGVTSSPRGNLYVVWGQENVCFPENPYKAWVSLYISTARELRIKWLHWNKCVGC